MACPERSENSPQSMNSDIAAEMAAIREQLEKVDANENPIERTFQREALLEKYDNLQAELDTSAESDQ